MRPSPSSTVQALQRGSAVQRLQQSPLASAGWRAQTEWSYQTILVKFALTIAEEATLAFSQTPEALT
jgi:hypothetical protein